MFATAGGTFITRITIDPLDSNVVYICTGGFTKGTIQRSEDGGATWMDATGTGDTGLPAVPVRDIEVDPSDPFTIYAGTEVGLFVSHDRGGTWQLPTDGPANVSVDELFFMGTTLVAATHGRGIFAADLNQQSGESIAMTPDHVDFGSQPVNTQSTSQSVVVSNTGSVSVTVQAVQVTSGYTDSFYFSSNNCNDVTLPPGGSCEFSVYVFARQTGAIDAVVSVASTVPGSPRRVALTATGIPQGVQAPWVQRDIGAVGYPGSASYANGLFTISGAGADIWGAADAFHFVYQPFSGDGTIVARVASFVTQDANAWAKTGVMMRATTDPASPHVSVYVTPGRGIALQWRSTAGGTTTNVAVAGAAPTFVRLGRSGGSITASYSSDGSAWTPLGTVSVTLPQSMLAGMPITSHDDPYTATARLDNVVVTAAAATLPPPWTQNDIGAVAIGGSAALSNGTFTIKGSGADIWGTADAFHYLHQPFSGDGWISARVDTVQNVNAWAKAGVMIRASTDPGAPHVSVYVTPGKGIALQWRSTAGGATSNMQANGAAPRYVRIGRSGDTLFTAAYSSDGTTWTTVGTVTVNLPESVLAGLAISSHDNTQAATSTIDQVSVRPALSAPWTQQDIGATGPAGHADNTNGTFTIEGSGADIWGTADAFHYVYQPLSGDTDIQAHVASVQNVNVWTKAGLMVRASTDAGATHVSVFVTPGKGIAMQWRASTGGASSSISVAGAAPVFIRLTRSGNNITAWYANDGSSWTAIGTATVVMSSDVFVGLAVTSHDNTQTATAVFDNVTFFSP
jgi:regulation of enolase protein 1 (concanavalin A-like superfamily)